MNTSDVNWTLTLDPCPEEGTGVHAWIHRSAVKLLAAGLTEEAAGRIIEGRCKARRHVAREVQESLRNAGLYLGTAPAGRAAWRPRERRRPRPRDWEPTPGWGCADWWEASPVKLEGGPLSAAVIDALFPGDPLLCLGRSAFDFTTARRSRFRGREHHFQLMVAGPMLARTGRTKAGKLSEHSLEATGPRRFAVVEVDPPSAGEKSSGADHAAYDYSSAVIHGFHQRCGLKLALVLLSGRRSVHAWWRCDGGGADRLERLALAAADLHLDPAQLKCRSQFVRAPDATRDNGERQSVLYFDPDIS